MFKLDEIKELIKLVDESSIHELELQNDNTKLSIRKPNKTESLFVNSLPAGGSALAGPQVQGAQAVQPVQQIPQEESVQATTTDAQDENLHTITSPMVGTFYEAPAPGAEPFVKVGSKVNENSVVCIVEAMKLMNEIEAEVKGEIAEILVENGQLVEYGQPLFLVKKE